MDISIAKIEALLRAEDIEGLIVLGAPDDEYACEARDVAAAVAKLPLIGRKVENVVAILSFVWAKSFHCADGEIRRRIPAFQRIAQGLMDG